ncbi:MAG TPA: hypothetical protein PKC72_01620 [Chitinophagaceae bacterium]|nr:hypothetical protein [Chitinophagaceae bacterium]
MVKEKKIRLEPVKIENEIFYRISHVDAMRPFFMSIVSDSNHWMFVSSNGGISAGRKNAEYALFPYYTDDKITESAEITGSKTIFRITKNEKTYIWEPFSIRSEGLFNSTRNLYKNKLGNKIIYEEVNADLELCFRYEWNSSNLFGIVRKAELINNGKTAVDVKILDGIQNIIPFGVGSDLQNKTSNLADAYKRSELVPESGLGIFALSAIIVDKAEPSEALKANVAWSAGIDNPVYLLSTLQIKNFRNNGAVRQEEDIKGERGAYFIISEIKIEAGNEKDWMIVANVNQTYAEIVALSEKINTHKNLIKEVQDDIDSGTDNLKKLTYAADGLQCTADDLRDTRHYSNVLFNIMRGGIFDNNYCIEKWDFKKYLNNANRKIVEEVNELMQQLPDEFTIFEMSKLVERSGNLNFNRLATEYLPLKFSRRHGDPSRPWNQFSINTRSEIDGSKILDYEGNWRDIFQNWEALAHSYPEFTEGMIYKFLNASTFDGYNPYRVTKDGFDWETIEPDNPWSYIGYWGDHQVIYLLKFLEFLENLRPGSLGILLEKNGFVYANIPYKIKSYSDILKNPKDTIVFDEDNDKHIRQRMIEMGADGALLTDRQGKICQVSFTEKILATLLSKISNFIPGGGIWMNTQRPEWNDANNALVGNGVSMVTLYYTRRFLKFFQPLLEKAGTKHFTLSNEMHSFFQAIKEILLSNQNLLKDSIDDAARKNVMDALGNAGSEFRNKIYTDKFSGDKKEVATNDLLSFINVALDFIEYSIRSNKRKDGLYHAYNLVEYDDHTATISYLSEMLEGQVAVLSSEYLSATESLEVLDALKKSALFREDQYSYLLYPNKELSRFLKKNVIPDSVAGPSKLLQQMIAAGDTSIVEKDSKGGLHFNGNFRNANDLEKTLDNLGQEYQSLVQKEKEVVLRIFEQVFNHKKFTGRSGTFFGYEGLGSIYWHMVSKLLLAVQETCLRAVEEKASEEIIGKLLEHYYEINEGIGIHKPPKLYGAFPTDPYSHTPLNKGAQQPGMTGQVKEDILSRFGELGIFIRSGRIVFKPVLLRKNELLTQNKEAESINILGEFEKIILEPNSLLFTLCQVPVQYILNNNKGVEIIRNGGSARISELRELTEDESNQLFSRSGKISQIKVFLEEKELR